MKDKWKIVKDDFMREQPATKNVVEGKKWRISNSIWIRELCIKNFYTINEHPLAKGILQTWNSLQITIKFYLV